MNITYRLSVAPLAARHLDQLVELAAAVFGPGDRLDGTWRLEHMPYVTCFEACHGERLVGFKLGYAVTSRRYYSWLGGVHPSYQRHGIARELMQRQHAWILEQGYAVIETEVRASNHAMAQLNTSCGFQAVGFKIAGDNQVIIYRKQL